MWLKKTFILRTSMLRSECSGDDLDFGNRNLDTTLGGIAQLQY